MTLCTLSFDGNSLQTKLGVCFFTCTGRRIQVIAQPAAKTSQNASGDSKKMHFLKDSLVSKRYRGIVVMRGKIGRIAIPINWASNMKLGVLPVTCSPLLV
jgi:hypothetical protein